MTILSERLFVKTGDITAMKVDAVVNAANSSLMGGGGVDGAIHRKGGSTILEECKEIRERRYPEGLPAGKAVLTTGGKLPAGHVIHTVGPIWRDGNVNEKQTLSDAYKNSLALAMETGMNSVAFPAISTGVYGFPKELAATIAYSTIRDHLKKRSLPREVYLVFFSQNDTDLFLQSIKELSKGEIDVP